MSFGKYWHRVALGIFVVCWITMLIPQLIYPNAFAARLLTLLLLGVGEVSVLTLLVLVYRDGN